MRKKTGNDATYASTFGQPSLFAHGSILGLYELSEAAANRGNDFAAYVFSDGQGSTMLLSGTAKILELAVRLMQHFGVGAITEWDAVKVRVDALLVRHNVISGTP